MTPQNERGWEAIETLGLDWDIQAQVLELTYKLNEVIDALNARHAPVQKAAEEALAKYHDTFRELEKD